MMIARFMVLVMLLFVAIGSTGCGAEPKNIPPKSNVPLSTMAADGTPIPAGETLGSADKKTASNVATEEEDEGE